MTTTEKKKLSIKTIKNKCKTCLGIVYEMVLKKLLKKKGTNTNKRKLLS
jgi:hypothetical protein